jgi:8-oxo-dGTP diphosphatase
MDRYVVGFAFNPSKTHVLLIEKTHPEWQRGKWNGIGGHIEEGELPLEAMIREAREETAIDDDFRWELYATMRGEDFVCFVFAGLITESPGLSDSGERLQMWAVPLYDLPRLANLDFLIAAALVRKSFGHLRVLYGLNGDTGQVK